MNGFMPGNLIAHLRSCADFAGEDETTQRRLALMLWKAQEPRRQHSAYPGCATFTKAEMRAIWGSESAFYKALAGKHFLALKGDNLSGFTVAYQPTRELLDALHRCLLDPEPCAFVDEDGEIVVRFPDAINPRRAYSQTRADEWRGAKPANRVVICEQGLQLYEPFASPLEKQVIAGLLRIARNTVQPGALPHRYTEYSTGRLFAGRFALQFASRNIRAAALTGCWDYDVANCHFAIISGLARRLGLEAHAIDHYLANKEAVRSGIAAQVKISAKAVKQCLLMAVYGATLSTSEHTAMVKMLASEFTRDFLNGLGKTMDMDAANTAAEKAGLAAAKSAARTLREHPQFASIYADIQTLRRPIIVHHLVRGDWVVNAMRLRKKSTEPERVLLSHITQGYEAAALRAVVRRHGEAILLCLHDGWVSRDRLDVAQCEADVMEATGLHLRIEESRFEHPVEGGRVRTEVEDDEPEIPLEDQALTHGDEFSYDSSSPLRGYPSSALRRRRVEPGDGLVLSLRAKWNYLPD